MRHQPSRDATELVVRLPRDLVAGVGVQGSAALEIRAGALVITRVEASPNERGCHAAMLVARIGGQAFEVSVGFAGMHSRQPRPVVGTGEPERDRMVHRAVVARHRWDRTAQRDDSSDAFTASVW